jgi:hypothetical protein
VFLWSLKLIRWDFDSIFQWTIAERYLGTYRRKIKVGMMQCLGDILVEIIDFFKLVKSSKSSSKVYIIAVI